MRTLLVDPRSRIAAELSGWQHTASAEWMLLARIHDVILDTTPGLKNTSTYYVPRPWKGAKRRVKRRSARTREEVRRILRPTTQ